MKQTEVREDANLSFDGFADKVKEEVQSRLGCEVELKKVQKNNGVVYTGMIVHNSESNAMPTIYLDDDYKRFVNGEEFESIVQRLVEIADQAKCTLDVNTDTFTDWESVKSRIVTKLVNKEKNEELLKSIPWVPFLDLAIVFIILVNKEANATVLVRNELLSIWGKSTDDLEREAKVNTQILLPPCVRDIAGVICSIDPELTDTLDDVGMLVVTNHRLVFGANTVLYDGLLRSIAERLDADLVILPSSVHEMLVLPFDSNSDLSKLNEMVREVNSTQLTEEEILSDHAYVYRRDTNEISLE